MSLPFLRSRAYESWAPFLARVIFGIQFLMGAAFKIPGTAGFTAEAGMTAAACTGTSRAQGSATAAGATIRPRASASCSPRWVGAMRRTTWP